MFQFHVNYSQINFFRNIIVKSIFIVIRSLQSRKGVKRKADTTTPHPAQPTTTQAAYTASNMALPAAGDTGLYKQQQQHTPGMLGGRRESGRPVKKPKKDLDDEMMQHSSKVRREPLSESLKYCGSILKELLSKKHAVSPSTPSCNHYHPM